MSEGVDVMAPVIAGLIATKGIYIIVPPGLVSELMQLACDYATQHREDPRDCLRGVEITILQRGMRALRSELTANKALGERMGWPKHED